MSAPLAKKRSGRPSLSKSTHATPEPKVSGMSFSFDAPLSCLNAIPASRATLTNWTRGSEEAAGRSAQKTDRRTAMMTALLSICVSYRLAKKRGKACASPRLSWTGREACPTVLPTNPEFHVYLPVARLFRLVIGPGRGEHPRVRVGDVVVDRSDGGMVVHA